MTTISRRVAIQVALGGLALPSALRATLAEAASSNAAASVRPIDGGECAARIAKVQLILQEQKLAAILVEAGSSLEYFTGIRWWRSERTTAAIIPATGQVVVVTPAFEEPSVRESLAIGDDVRPWNEHESPFQRIVQAARPRHERGPVAVETTTRFFIVDGIRAASRASTSSCPATSWCARAG